MRRPEEEEAAPLAAVGQQLDGIQEVGRFLDLVEDDQAVAVVEMSHGVGGEPEAFVWVIQGEVDARGLIRAREEIADRAGGVAIWTSGGTLD